LYRQIGIFAPVNIVRSDPRSCRLRLVCHPGYRSERLVQKLACHEEHEIEFCPLGTALAEIATSDPIAFLICIHISHQTHQTWNNIRPGSRRDRRSCWNDPPAVFHRYQKRVCSAEAIRIARFTVDAFLDWTVTIHLPA